MVWALIALVIAAALSPAVDRLERLVRRRSLAALAVVLAALAAVAGALALIAPAVVSQVGELAQAAPTLVTRLGESAAFRWVDTHLDVAERLRRFAAENVQTAARSAVTVAGGAVSGVAGTVTVVVLVAFMLVFGPAALDSAIGWTPAATRPRLREVARRMRRAVGGYVVGAALVAVVGGVVTGVTTALLDVPWFLALGALMALLGFVPFLGAAIGGVLVVAMSFAASGTRAGVIAAVVFVAYQQVEGNLLQPLIQRRTIRMNPLVIALVVLFGSAIAGVTGAVLALPLAAMGQVALEELRDAAGAED